MSKGNTSKGGAASAEGAARRVGVVVVDAEAVQGRRDGLEVAVLHEGQGAFEAEGRQVGVAAQEHGVGEQAAVEGVVGRRRRAVALVVAAGDRGGVAVGEHDVPGAGGAQGRSGEAVAEELVVAGGESVEEEGAAGGVLAERVAEGHVLERFVQGDPVPHAVAEAVGGDAGVVGEAVGGVAVEPAARAGGSAVLERLREVPVEEGGHGGDPGVEEGVDEPVVEVESGLVGGAGPGGLDAGPADREAVDVDAEVPHQGDVLGVAAVVVAGGLGGVAVADPPGRGREGVPYGRSTAALGRGAFDLEGRCGDPPGESVGQSRHCGHRNLRE
jgi:hypothetical protein